MHAPRRAAPPRASPARPRTEPRRLSWLNISSNVRSPERTHASSARPLGVVGQPPSLGAAGRGESAPSAPPGASGGGRAALTRMVMGAAGDLAGGGGAAAAGAPAAAAAAPSAAPGAAAAAAAAARGTKAGAAELSIFFSLRVKVPIHAAPVRGAALLGRPELPGLGRANNGALGPQHRCVQGLRAS
jgi:hypothetical protein